MSTGSVNLQSLDQVTPASLKRLHRSALEGPSEVNEILRRVCRERARLSNGINRRNEPRSAHIEAVLSDRLHLRTRNFRGEDVRQLYLSFEIGGNRYFFAADPVAELTGDLLQVKLPTVIFHAERRDASRTAKRLTPTIGSAVDLEGATGRSIRAKVIDRSDGGLGVDVSAAESVYLHSDLTVRFLDGSRQGEFAHASLRHRTPSREGWVRVGLELRQVARSVPVAFDRRDEILARSVSHRVRDKLSLWRESIAAVSARAAQNVGLGSGERIDVSIVEYMNNRGEPIRAILNTWGEPNGAPAILIPPAWGRTKETLLPLALTIIETFRRAGEPVIVLRFDGTHRRGESYVAPEFRKPGSEYLGFTFSQAVQDIRASIDYLATEFDAESVTLASFSLAAIEARRAIATDYSGRVAGWVSVVGPVDLQSTLRTISGGIDYGYGLLEGVRFGKHELVGVIADMDLTGLDAIENRLVFLDDARRDMAEIKVPVTWIHGRDDAWMDLDRVRDVVSCGNTSNRRLIEVPTGHQLRTSAEALQTFQLVAEELSEMLLGERLRAHLPNIAELALRSATERDRAPKANVNLREFWRDYLLGRDRSVGMQLLTATAAYRNLVATQTASLELEAGMRIADLGSGTGEFPVHLARSLRRPESLVVDEFDYVPEALRRCAERLATSNGADDLEVRRVLANLDLGSETRIPAEDASYDAALASLLISYLRDGEAFVREVHRVLRPGGRLVISSLRRDADISKIYLDGMQELESGAAKQVLGSSNTSALGDLARSTLNDASKILDLEEQGRFQFWDAEELAALVRRCGFTQVKSELCFGDPAQAVVVSARRA